MMLKEKIQEDFKKFLKERKEIEVSTLRMLSSAIFNREKEKRYKLSKEKPDLEEKDLEKESQLTDEEIIQVVFSEVKKRKEAIEGFEKGKRMDLPRSRLILLRGLVEKEKKELEILQKYLPKQLSEEEVKKMAKEVIVVLRASLAPEEREKIGLKDMGKVMGNLMPKLKGKAEGNLVNKIVKELLS